MRRLSGLLSAETGRNALSNRAGPHAAGNYAKELEEDFLVYDAISEVQAVVLANEGKCNTFRQQYSRFEYLWKKDLTASLQVRPAVAFSS